MNTFSEIKPHLEQWAQRYRNSALAAFLSWWGNELYGMIPARWRARMVAPRSRLWLLVESEDVSLSVWRGGEQPEGMDTLGAAEDLAALRQRWQTHLRQFRDGPPEVSLLLPPDLVLDAPVELPLAVESNLAQAVSYQLDQLTPFRADQVWHDFRVLGREAEAGRLRLDLRLVPKVRLEALFERLDAIGIRPHIVDVASAPSRSALQVSGFNLLPTERRRPYVNRRARLNWGLGLGVVAMLAVVMGLSLQVRGAGLEQLRAEVNTLRAEAEEVLALQRELEDALDAANFLAEHRREQPVIMDVLDELTRVLPNDMWLQQVQVRERDLSLTGSGNGSQRLIELINGSSLFSDTAFRGSVNIDPNTGQERFNATATITPWGLQDAVAARTQE